MGDDPAVERQQDRCTDDDLHNVPQDQKGTTQQVWGKPWDIEMWRKSSPEHGKNLQAKNDKAPEDEKMHPAGGLLASDKFLLAKGVDEYRLKALSDVIKAVDRPSGKQEPQAVIDSAHKQPHSSEHD